MTAVNAQPLGGFVPIPDHDELPGLLDDDHTQYALLAGRAGGQTLFGGTAAGNILNLWGSSAGGDAGFIHINSPVQYDYDTFSDTQQFAIIHNPTAAITGSYIGGFLSVAAIHNVTTGVYIPATFSDTTQVNVGATPGFSAFTFINELAVIRNNGNFNLPSALVMNIGLTHERNTSGTSTTPGPTGISFSPQTRATVSGAVMTKTTQIGLRFSPTFSTVSGSTVNMGTNIGVQMNDLNPALFQPQAGIENVTAVYGLVMNNMTRGGAGVTRAAVLGGLAASSNNYLIKQNSSAPSDFAGSHIYFNDGFGVAYGQSYPLFDVWQNWNAAGYFRTYFASTTDSLRWSSPAADRFLFDNDGGSTSGEYNFNCARFSLGAQTGAVGNQVGVFVTPARTTSLAGGWSDFLLTQAGNITVDDAMGQLAGWTVNAPSITLGTGSVTDGIGLLVGGNPGSATNRYGLLVLSSPSGGTLNYCARFQGAAGVRVDGIFEHGNANLGFYGTAPIAQQLGVAVTAAGIHAALVALGLIT